MVHYLSLNALFTKAGILDRTSEMHRKTVIANAIKNSQNDEEKESQVDRKSSQKPDHSKSKTPIQTTDIKSDQSQASSGKPSNKNRTDYDPNFKHSFTTVTPGKLWPLESEPYKNDPNCRFCKKPNHRVDKCYKLRATCQQPDQKESYFVDQSGNELSVSSNNDYESEPDEISDNEI